MRDVGHGWFSSYQVPGTYYLVAADGWLHVYSTYFTLFSFFRGGRMSAPPTAVVGRLWSVFGGRAVTYGLYVQFLGYYGMMMCVDLAVFLNHLGGGGGCSGGRGRFDC